MTLLEAMAAGLPVVAANIPGVDEVVVDGETGRLFTRGETTELASLLSLVSDRQTRRRFGQAGFDRVSSLFDIETTASTYRELYRRVARS